MRSRISISLLLLPWLTVAAGRAQSVAPAREVPFAAPGPVSPAGERARRLADAQLMQDLGLLSSAIEAYKLELAKTDLGDSERQRLMIALLDAYLDQGDVGEAEKVLNAISEPHGSAWHLRAGLVSTNQQWINAENSKRWIDAAKAHESVIRREDLTATEAPWLAYLRGQIQDADEDREGAERLYAQAMAESSVDSQKSLFLLAQHGARLRRGVETPEDAQALRAFSNLQARSQPIAFEAAKLTATALAHAGRQPEARAFVEAQLANVPPGQPAWADTFQLMKALIVGPATLEGRAPLRLLLSDGKDAHIQRAALQLMARHALGPELRRELDSQLLRAPKHPIRDDLLALRAELELRDKSTEGYERAVSDANELLQNYPGSPWKAHALVVMASAAWGQTNYRTAADSAAKARDAVGSGPVRANLAVLVAESYFRAELFASAAAAYDAALIENPEIITRGELIFQRVLSEIAATDFRDPASAAKPIDLLDQLAREPAFAINDRWKAEWNLARALTASKQANVALVRVTRLLQGAQGAGTESRIPPGLRARMEWLRASLTLDAGIPGDPARLEEAARLARALMSVEAVTGLDEITRAEISSQAALVLAQALFSLGKGDEAVKVLSTLRATYPTSAAAAYSHLIHADYIKNTGKIPEAIELLNRMVEEFPQSSYAPSALFQSAELEKGLGEEKNLQEANNRLDRLVEKYPGDALVLPAKMFQGDIMRLLNKPEVAQQSYESIVNDPRYYNRPEALLAVLKLADTHSLQAPSSGAYFERAQDEYRRVFQHAKATTDMKLEAAYKLGLGFDHKKDPVSAQHEWSNALKPYLNDPASVPMLGATGPFWIRKIIRDLAKSIEAQGKISESKDVLQLLQKLGLDAGNSSVQAPTTSGSTGTGAGDI